MNIEEIRSLWGFNTWATHKILDACQVLSDEEFNRNLGNSFNSVRATVVHLMGAEWVWLQRWLGDSPRSLLPQEEFPNLAAIEARWMTLAKQQQTFFLTLTDDRLAEKISYVNLRGQPAAYTLAHMIQHLVNHGTYHRGQVVTMLRQLGHPAPSTDLLLYVDEDPV